MTRPGNNNHYLPYPGHHNLDLSNTEDHIFCGPNEHPKDGCCVCDIGYERDKTGRCVYTGNYTPIFGGVDGKLLQENDGIIFCEVGRLIYILNYDPSYGTDDPCYAVTCGANSTCVNGECVCNEGFEKNSNGVCVQIGDPISPPDPIVVDKILQENNSIIYIDDIFAGAMYNVLQYDPSFGDPNSCVGVECGNNATCVNGVCVCNEGFELVNGICQIVQDPGVDPGPIIPPKVSDKITQDASATRSADSLIYVDNSSDIVDKLRYDPSDDVDNPCYAVTCGDNSTCIDGTCTCNPGFAPDANGLCLPVVVPPDQTVTILRSTSGDYESGRNYVFQAIYSGLEDVDSYTWSTFPNTSSIIYYGNRSLPLPLDETNAGITFEQEGLYYVYCTVVVGNQTYIGETSVFVAFGNRIGPVQILSPENNQEMKLQTAYTLTAKIYGYPENPQYLWEIPPQASSNNLNKNNAVIQFQSLLDGSAKIYCTVSDSNAVDSPQRVSVTVTTASPAILQESFGFIFVDDLINNNIPISLDQ